MGSNKSDEPRCCYCGTLNPEKLRMRDEGQRLTIGHLLTRQEMFAAELHQLADVAGCYRHYSTEDGADGGRYGKQLDELVSTIGAYAGAGG